MEQSRTFGRDLLNYSKFILPVGIGAILATVLAVGWYTQPDRYVIGYQPTQPIPYSHRLHAGTMQMPCEYCHTGVRQSRQAAVPPLDTCMNCHKVTRTDQPAIRRVAALAASGEAVLWKRIHRLPDFVFFDHRPHVAAGLICQTCHGEIEGMDVVAQRMSLRMGNCLGCHRDPKAALPPGSPIRQAPQDCWACHR